MTALPSRRAFLHHASAAALVTALPVPENPKASINEFERPRVLRDAEQLLPPSATQPRLLDVQAGIATLTAAYVITKEDRFAAAAIDRLSRITSALPAPDTTSKPTVAAYLPLAEVFRAAVFLLDVLPDEAHRALDDLAKTLLTRLTTERPLLIERDRKDHRASEWLLLTTSIARLTRNERQLDANRKLFRRPLLRNQIDVLGRFPQEMATPNPYRNTLYNYDLLSASCQLLSSPLEDLFPFELVDGIGLHAVAAYLYPFIAAPKTWPGIADAEHFRLLPGRRPALLFCGRAYNRPEYVDLWRNTPAAIPAELAPTFPVREPVLWVTRAPHGL